MDCYEIAELIRDHIMELTTLLLFSMTAVPLICTADPDILFTDSQGLFSGRRGALRAKEVSTAEFSASRVQLEG